MRALVTGGRGFVGRHLERHLIESGDDVVAIDLEHDVADAADMQAVITDVDPDAIYHLAAISHVGDSWNDPTAVLRVNVLGTAAVLAAARRAPREVTTLFVSSAEVYGAVRPEDLPLNEDSVVAPSSPYAASKLAAEVIAQQATRGYGQRIVIARPFNHFGPGQSPNFFIPALAQRLVDARASGAGSIAVGNLSTRRDYTDVRDVVRAYRLLVQRGESGTIYNVASGVDRSMLEIAETLRNYVDPKIGFETDPALLRPVDIPVLRGNYERLRDATGWEPTTSFDDTLRDLLESVESASTPKS